MSDLHVNRIGSIKIMPLVPHQGTFGSEMESHGTLNKFVKRIIARQKDTKKPISPRTGEVDRVKRTIEFIWIVSILNVFSMRPGPLQGLIREFPSHL